jgi:hypothetical protein
VSVKNGSGGKIGGKEKGEAEMGKKRKWDGVNPQKWTSRSGKI